MCLNLVLSAQAGLADDLLSCFDGQRISIFSSETGSLEDKAERVVHRLEKMSEARPELLSQLSSKLDRRNREKFFSSFYLELIHLENWIDYVLISVRPRKISDPKISKRDPVHLVKLFHPGLNEVAALATFRLIKKKGGIEKTKKLKKNVSKLIRKLKRMLIL